MAIQVIGFGSPDGTTIGVATDEKIGVYGKAVVQAAFPGTVTAGSTTTVCNTAVAALITAVAAFGITAAS